MPKPATKKELIASSKANYEKLTSLINTLSKAEREESFPQGTLNRNIRDVLTHLHHWHLLTLEWHRTCYLA